MSKLFRRLSFFKLILKGIAQIMLQENAYTGAIFLAVILFVNPLCAAAVFLATTVGTAMAILMKYDRKEIESGLYGFSAALVGAALSTLFTPNFILLFCIVLGAVLAAVLQNFFIQRKIPAFTFPFILVTWIFYFLIIHFGLSTPLNPENMGVSTNNFQLIFGVFRGYGQVFFQTSLFAGILFFVGVLVSSRISAVFGLMGTFLGVALSKMGGFPQEQISLGVFGFNAVLSAIVFAGTKKTDAFWATIAVVFTIIIDFFFAKTKILNHLGGVFTFPFVLGIWCTLLLQKSVLKRNKKD